MYNPHAGKDSKEEKYENDYEESDGESENCGSPVALVAGHCCVLPSGVKVCSISCLRSILKRKEKRWADEVLIIRLKLGSGVADLALMWGSPLSRVCLAIPALRYK